MGFFIAGPFLPKPARKSILCNSQFTDKEIFSLLAQSFHSSSQTFSMDVKGDHLI